LVTSSRSPSAKLPPTDPHQTHQPRRRLSTGDCPATLPRTIGEPGSTNPHVTYVLSPAQGQVICPPDGRFSIHIRCDGKGSDIVELGKFDGAQVALLRLRTRSNNDLFCSHLGDTIFEPSKGKRACFLGIAAKTDSIQVEGKAFHRLLRADINSCSIWGYSGWHQGVGNGRGGILKHIVTRRREKRAGRW
jgi:hypothetical protein